MSYREEVKLILKYDAYALSLFEEGKFLKAANSLLLFNAHGIAQKLKALSLLIAKEEKEKVRTAKQEARERALAEKKAAKEVTLEQQLQKLIAEKEAALSAAIPAAKKAAQKALQATPQYKRRAAAYMQYWLHKTEEARLKWEAAKADYEANKELLEKVKQAAYEMSLLKGGQQ